MVHKAVISEDTVERDAETISRMIKKPREEVKIVLDAVLEDRRNHKRQPKEPAPDGGITLREAAKKYSVPDRTIGRWAKRGYIPILLITKNEVYIDESTCSNIVKAYKAHPSPSRKALKTILKLS